MRLVSKFTQLRAAVSLRGHVLVLLGKLGIISFLFVFFLDDFTESVFLSLNFNLPKPFLVCSKHLFKGIIEILDIN